MTTMQIKPETARDDFAPNADRPERSEYGLPAPESACHASTDLDEEKVAEAEEEAARVAEMCGL